MNLLTWKGGIWTQLAGLGTAIPWENQKPWMRGSKQSTGQKRMILWVPEHTQHDKQEEWKKQVQVQIWHWNYRDLEQIHRAGVLWWTEHFVGTGREDGTAGLFSLSWFCWGTSCRWVSRVPTWGETKRDLQNHRISEWEGTHGDHWTQLLVLHRTTPRMTPCAWEHFPNSSCTLSCLGLWSLP